MATVYRTSELKRRRSTRSEIDTIDAAIHEIAAEEYPITIRGLFYRVVSRGLVPKTDKAKNGVPSGYGMVQRRTLAMRRNGSLPYGWITDGTRLRLQPNTWHSAEGALLLTAAHYRRATPKLRQIVSDAIEQWIDPEALRITKIAEHSEKQVLTRIAGRWDDEQRNYAEGYVR